MTEDDTAQAEYSPADRERIGTEWIDRIKESEKREDAWIKSAEKAEAAYLCDEEAQDAEIPDFNILHSNVETIVPAIYNSTPRPEIRPRHTRDDKAGKYIADIHERVIMALIDDSALDKEIEAGAQDAFMAGRDIVRVKFDADVQPIMTVDQYGQPVETWQVTDENVFFECVSWRDFRLGPAKRWRDVPWVAYGHDVSDEEREKLENPEYTTDDDKRDQPKDCRVWEIWCKETKRVYFVVEETCKLLNVVDDPLGLKAFFPQGEPVQPIKGTGKMTPVCPYAAYKSLAEELDTATRRIRKIMQGLKVRGAIAGDATVAALISEADDNEVVSLANVENLAATGGLEKAVMWWPVETAIAVLRELYLEREQTKQAIYEVTGISDIIRGQGAASETATAQQIKTQWGALRVKKMQRLIERQVRGIFLLCAEIVCKHFTSQTIQKMSGMQLPAEIEPQFRKWDEYRIDVESDSTIRADATKNRQEMGEFLNATASYFKTMAPIAQSAPGAIGPIAKMYAAFAQQFNLGKQAEDALDELIQLAEKAGQNPQPSAEETKAKQEAEQAERQFQLDTARFKLDETKVAQDGKKLMLEAMKAQAEHKLDVDRLQLDEAVAEAKAAKDFDDIKDDKEQMNGAG